MDWAFRRGRYFASLCAHCTPDCVDTQGGDKLTGCDGLGRRRTSRGVPLSDLFSQDPVDRKNVPLAEQLRPQTPDEVIGQQHLLGQGKPLRLAFASGQPHSMILWGPPGVGKTTLARMMATQFNCEFIALSAVFSGIKEVREAVSQAEIWRSQGKRTILFVDEIHRFNKAMKKIQFSKFLH